MRGSIHARDGRPIAVTSPIYRLFIDFRAEALAPLRKPLPPRGGSKKDSLQRAKVLELRAEFDAGLDSLAELMATTHTALHLQAMVDTWRVSDDE